MSWRALELADAELAAFGHERLGAGVAYLGTIRPDGSPRVHPVTPIIREGRLFVFMEPTSPKGRDLDRDPRFALHCGVADSSGGAGELIVSGRAVRLTDEASRAAATAAASYAPAKRYVLFELCPDRVQGTIYAAGGPVRRQWPAASRPQGTLPR